MAERSVLGMVLMHVVLLAVLIGSITLVFDYSRFAFFGELLILGALIFLAIIVIAGLSHYTLWVWKLLTFFFIIVFLNLLFMYLLKIPDAFVFKVVFYASIIGLVVSILFASSARRIHHTKDESNKVSTESKTVRRSHSPGKFVSSARGATYHIPKCDWAKRISTQNRVWYQNKQDAAKDGNKPHDCVN